MPGRQMVQCQKTRRYLGAQQRTEDGIWTCNVCPERERYVRVPQGALLDAVDAAIERARLQYGRTDDGIQTVVWLGESPETVFEEALGAYHIYLSRDAGWHQLMFSASHEVYHRVCSARNVVTWRDEMMAVRFSLRYLRLIGEDEYAHEAEEWLIANAVRCPTPLARLEADFAEALAADSLAVYGAVFELGRELEQAVTPDAMDGLVRHYDTTGDIDFTAWLTSLDQELAERAAATSAVRTGSRAWPRLVAPSPSA